MAEENDRLTDAAILLMGMGADAAAQVISELSPREAQKLGEKMASLKTTRSNDVTAVLERLEDRLAETDFLIEDTDEYVRAVLTRGLGDTRAGLLIDRILSSSEVDGIENLKWMEAQDIANMIRNEHPQVIASILVHLERDQASETLLALPENIRSEVILRISTMDGIQPAAIEELDVVLAKLLAGKPSGQDRKLGGAKTAAEILNLLGNGLDREVLDWITEQDEDLAQQISDQMFIFADLMRLDDKAIQTVMRELQTESLIMALKGAEPDLREKVFRNMSQRAAESLREDLDSRGPVKISDVESEQKEIIKTVKRLAEEGQITMSSGGADDSYV
ncbi:MAG: flagellar motor switch protein FliG [Burkholderiaceae bacterium]